MKTVLYCKYANDRNKQFKIKTIIYKENNKIKVEKSCLNKEGEAHIKNIYDNYKKLKNLVALSVSKDINITESHLKDNSIEFEYIEGELWTKKLNDLVEDNKYNDFFNEIEKYKDIIIYGQHKEKFNITDEFKAIFGSIEAKEDWEAVKINNIDFIFDNVIINEKINIFDYEWVVDFQVPLKYILYRAIKYYIIQLEKKNITFKINIWDNVGISDNEKIIFEIMECNFYNYVNENYVNLHDFSSTWGFNKNEYQVLKIMNDIELIKKQKKYQVFFDYGNGFSEENSYEKPYECDEFGNVTLRISLSEKIKGVRLDPSKDNCMIIIDYMHVYGYGNTEEIRYESNANWNDNNVMIFITDDSQIIFDNIDYLNKLYIEIKFKISYLPTGDLYSLKNILSRVNELKKDVDEEKKEVKLLKELVKQQLQEKKIIDNLYEKEIQGKEEYLEKLNFYEETLNNIYNSKGWKILTKLRNIRFLNNKK